MRPPRLVLLAVVLLPATTHAYKLKRTHGGTPLRWKGGVASFSVPSNVPGLAHAARAAARTWAHPGWVGVEVRNHRDPRPVQAKVVWETDWSYPDDHIALTVLSYEVRTGGIIDVEVQLNAGTPWGPPPRLETFDLQGSLTHEIGHALGLAHSDAKEATMYASISKGDVLKRALAKDDQLGLEALYRASEAEQEGPEGCASTRPESVLLCLLGLGLLVRRRPRG